MPQNIVCKYLSWGCVQTLPSPPPNHRMTDAKLRHDPQSLMGGVTTRAAIPGSLIEWACLALAPSAQCPAMHHRFLLRHLDSICRGETDRLMVLMPPGSAKSTYVSILYTPWWFRQHPGSSVITTSHTRRSLPFNSWVGCITLPPMGTLFRKTLYFPAFRGSHPISLRTRSPATRGGPC